MNLRKVMFWKRSDPPAQQATVSAFQAVQPAGQSFGPPAGNEQPLSTAQVIPMPQAANLSAVSTDAPAVDDFSRPPGPTPRLKGLMNAPELEAFFKANQFVFGRYHGSHYRSAEALERGLEAVVAEFQNIVADLSERRQAKLDKLQITRQDVATLSPAMADQLDLAAEQTRREIGVLHEQSSLAGQRRGWVLDALNRYRLGFDRGVRDAIDFELLNA